MTEQSPAENRPARGPRSAWILILLVGLGVGLGWFFVSPQNTPETASGPAAPVPSAASSESLGAPPATLPQKSATALSAREGREAVIQLEDWPPGQLLIVDLTLAEEADSDFGIKSAWIYQESADPLQLQAQRSGPRGFRAELPRDALAPGRAIVELRTDEKKSRALRRFAIQIR